ncbi:hypothetical protein D3C81_1416860 [compost metagenome]
MIQDRRVDVVAEVVVVETRRACRGQAAEQLRIQRWVRCADVGLQRGERVSTQGHTMIEQIGQRPRCRVNAVGQLQLRPVLGQRAVQAQHAPLIQQLRQQTHVGLGLRSNVHRCDHRQWRAAVGIARAAHIAQHLPFAIHDHHRITRPQSGNAVQEGTQPLRGVFRRCSRCDHHAAQPSGQQHQQGQAVAQMHDVAPWLAAATMHYRVSRRLERIEPVHARNSARSRAGVSPLCARAMRLKWD